MSCPVLVQAADPRFLVPALSTHFFLQLSARDVLRPAFSTANQSRWQPTAAQCRYFIAASVWSASNPASYTLQAALQPLSPPPSPPPPPPPPPPPSPPYSSAPGTFANPHIITSLPFVGASTTVRRLWWFGMALHPVRLVLTPCLQNGDDSDPSSAFLQRLLLQVCAVRSHNLRSQDGQLPSLMHADVP